jgi:hypothetical protein
VSGGINQIAQRMEEIQLEDDETAAREALLATSDELRDLQRGENGYLTTAGRDAVEGYDDYQARVDEIVNGRMSSLSERQREMYEAAVMSRRESALNSGASHAATQRREYQVTVFGAQLEDATALALEGRGTPQFNEARDQAFHAIERAGRLQGMDAEQIERSQRQWLSQSRMASIAAELDLGNIEVAEAIAEAAREGEEFAGTDATSVEAMLRNANSARRVEQARDEIFGRFGSDMTAGLAYIRDNFEGDEETDVASAYRRRVRDESVSNGTTTARLLEEIEQAFVDGRYASLSDIPIAQLDAIGSRGEDIIERRFIQNSRYYAAETDIDYVENLDWLARNDPDALAAMNPLDFRDHVSSRQQYQELREWWEIANDETRDTPDLPSVFSDQQALIAAMDAANIRGEEERVEFGRRFQRRLEALASRNPDYAPSDRDAILQDLTAETIISDRNLLDRGSRVRGSVSLGEDFEGVSAFVRDELIDFYGDRLPEAATLKAEYDRVVASLEEDGIMPSDGPAYAALVRSEFEYNAQQLVSQQGLAAAEEILTTRFPTGEPHIRIDLRALGYPEDQIDFLTENPTQQTRAESIVRRGLRYEEE